MKVQITHVRRAFEVLVGATALGLLGHWLTYRGQNNDSFYKELSIKPDVFAGYDRIKHTMSWENRGNGAAHIGKVIIYANNECFNSDKSDFYRKVANAYIKEDIEMTMDRAIDAMIGNDDDQGQKVEFELSQFPLPGDVIQKGERIHLFNISTTDYEIAPEEFDRFTDYIEDALMIDFQVCSDSGGSCVSARNPPLRDDCTRDYSHTKMPFTLP